MASGWPASSESRRPESRWSNSQTRSAIRRTGRRWSGSVSGSRALGEFEDHPLGVFLGLLAGDDGVPVPGEPAGERGQTIVCRAIGEGSTPKIRAAPTIGPLAREMQSGIPSMSSLGDVFDMRVRRGSIAPKTVTR